MATPETRWGVERRSKFMSGTLCGFAWPVSEIVNYLMREHRSVHRASATGLQREDLNCGFVHGYRIRNPHFAGRTAGEFDPCSGPVVSRGAAG